MLALNTRTDTTGQRKVPMANGRRAMQGSASPLDTQPPTAQRVPEAQLLPSYLLIGRSVHNVPSLCGHFFLSIYFAIYVILEAPLKISPAAKATTDITLALEANRSKTLSHGINYSNLWSFQRSRWQRKRKLRLISDSHLYSLC